MVSHVALRKQMLSGPEYSLERLLPILHRLAIDPYNDMPDNRRTNSFVGESKMNVGRVAAGEFENRPHRRADLLALHVGGVARNTERQKSNDGRDYYIVSA